MAASAAIADTVWLKNGDRLTGKIKFYEGQKLLLKTEYGGAIALDWDQIETLESDQELLIKENALAGERAKSLRKARAMSRTWTSTPYSQLGMLSSHRPGGARSLAR